MAALHRAGTAGLAVHNCDSFWAVRITTLERYGDKDVIAAYGMGNGRQMWAYRYNALPGNGGTTPLAPRAAPAVVHRDASGKGCSNCTAFCLDADGQLTCLDTVAGRLEWSAFILTDNANLAEGMAASPVPFLNSSSEWTGSEEGDCQEVYKSWHEVIVAPGVQSQKAKGRALIAYDATTGKELCAFGNHRGGYSTPIIARLNGREQLIVFDGDGLTGYDPKEGRELWHYAAPTPPGQFNGASPLALDDSHIVISSETTGCVLLRVAPDDTPHVVWRNQNMRCRFATPIYSDGYLYGFNDGALVCLDAKTGQRKWSSGRYGQGQLTLVGRHLLVLSQTGDLALVEATPERYRQLGKVRAVNGRTFAPPEVDYLTVFVRSDQQMAALRLPAVVLPAPDSASIAQVPCD